MNLFIGTPGAAIDQGDPGIGQIFRIETGIFQCLIYCGYGKTGIGGHETEIFCRKHGALNFSIRNSGNQTVQVPFFPIRHENNTGSAFFESLQIGFQSISQRCDKSPTCNNDFSAHYDQPFPEKAFP